MKGMYFCVSTATSSSNMPITMVVDLCAHKQATSTHLLAGTQNLCPVSIEEYHIQFTKRPQKHMQTQ
ncbi:hypothetical protein EXN66_Car019953 [Channa argus]|uniref:Uncharacterized protein n=1 Tax=Channa argus TaxID=215402 RepID=A0A6G1QP57_CHAAH|nr:hypothetical protein EXN66_Car019953 [Channa argus]